MTSPRTFNSGPPELPGLIAASVWITSDRRCGVTGNGSRPVALMTPTLTVCASPNGLPIAITQSPGSIWLESPNFASGRGRLGFSTSWIKRAVRQRIAADDLGLVVLVVFIEELHLDFRRIFNDVIVREDEPFAVMMNPEPAAWVERSRGCCAVAPLSLDPGPGAPGRRRTARADRRCPRRTR